MTYDLHIERADEQPIALGEWCAAVEATEGVRLMDALAHKISDGGELYNLETGEVLDA